MRRDDLIRKFIMEHGNDIKESASKQTGNPFFESKWAEDDWDEHLYSVNENGYMIEMTMEETLSVKKKFKRGEIRNKIDYSQIALKIRPFDVFQAFFPYSNEPDIFSIRPVIAVPVGLRDYRFMMVTKGKNTDPVYRVYETPLSHMRKFSLPFSSYARTNIVRDSSSLIFIGNARYYGSLTDDDIEGIHNARTRYVDDLFINPIAFMYWCLENKVQDTIPLYGNNNNINPIQDIEDIKHTKRANCVDLAIASYKMARGCSIISDATIGIVRWIIGPNKTSEYVFMLFKYKGKIYAFDYDQYNYVGEFPSFKTQSFEQAAEIYSNNIKTVQSDVKVRNLSRDKQLVYILNNKALNDLDYTYEYNSQFDWLYTII